MTNISSNIGTETTNDGSGITTFGEWQNRSSNPSDGDLATYTGGPDDLLFQYDTSLSNSEIGSAAWRLIGYPNSGSGAFRTIPLTDGSGSLSGMRSVVTVQGVSYPSQTQVDINLADDGDIERFRVHANFYLPERPIVRCVGNISGLVPSDFNSNGVRLEMGVRDAFEDNTNGPYSSYIASGDGGSFGDTTSRTQNTNESSPGFTNLDNKSNDHRLFLEGARAPDDYEYREVVDIGASNKLRTDEGNPANGTLKGGRIELYGREYTSTTDYSITPPSVTMKNLEVFL